MRRSQKGGSLATRGNARQVTKVLSRSTYCEPVDAQRGLAHAHGHALAFLAAGAHARIELHVVADHGHAGERVGAVAHDGCALDRVLDLAVLDPKGLARREHELAARDVDLPAAEVGGVEALLD